MLYSEKESSNVGCDFSVKSTDSFQKKYLQPNEDKFTWNCLWKKPQFGGFWQKILSAGILDDLIEFFCKVLLVTPVKEDRGDADVWIIL